MCPTTTPPVRCLEPANLAWDAALLLAASAQHPVLRHYYAGPSAPAPAPAPAAPSSSYEDKPFDVGTSAVNLGIGLGSRYSYALGGFGGSSSVLPAVSVSFERGIIPLGPGVLGVGGIIGY